jgi:RND family efflux transporter MFP subunit
MTTKDEDMDRSSEHQPSAHQARPGTLTRVRSAATSADARRVRLFIVAGVVVILVALFAMHLHAAARTNQVALAASPRPVSVQKAKAASFRPVRSYVGTTQPWTAARVGPQYVSAYVGAVLVRPGAAVKRGEVLATLDCRNTSASSREVAAKARALSERQAALEHEAERTRQMQAGGFASANELEQLTARSASGQAEVESLRASLVSRGLEVDDCVLRAPFAGEVAERYVDPGAYARPGNPIVSVVDRSRIRISADASESDFTVVAPGTLVHILIEATGEQRQAVISRRAPSADDATRTVHFEIDVANADHVLPAGSTARITIDVGQPQPAIELPLRAATVRGDQATVFVVENAVAHRRVVAVLGEAGGILYVAPALAAGAPVVVEGRALLDDGDRVAAQEQAL